MRVTATAQGVEIHFPPLRAPVAALAVGAFGLSCLLLAVLAAGGMLSSGGSEAYGQLVIALMIAFAVPFPVFGALFTLLAVYMLANSLTVEAGAHGIRATRRLFGFAVGRRAIAATELAAIEAEAAARYQGLLSAEPCFRLVARHATQRGRDVVLADALRGETLAAEVQALIARHAGLKLQ